MQQSDRPQLSVVVPAFNEAERVGACIERATAYLAAQSYASELIVVSDGSTDATAQIAREAGRERVRVIEMPTNRGKGFAVRTGVLAAAGSHVLFSDVDFSTPIDEVERFLAAVSAGFDVVVGSRALPDSDVRVRQAWWRQSMGRTFNHIARAAIGFEMRDTQCGFKCFRRAAARAIFSRARIDRYAFDVELLWIAERLSLRVGELPVIWVDDPHSKVHPIRDSLRMIVDLAVIRRHDARGVYEASPVAPDAPDQRGPAK
jgi:dolichyl-phosphate beta-glucosyltransferase